MIEDFTPRKLPIVTEKYKLQEPASPVTDEDDVEALKELLFLNLRLHEGVGLAANQIGIDRRVAVVDVKEPFVLVNPELVAMGGQTAYVESCLSFPDETAKTERFVEVEVEADNFEGSLVFGPPPDSFNPKEPEDLDNPEVLESVVVQHECLPRDAKLQTEDGTKRIKDVVEDQYDGKVLSYDFDSGSCTWSEVTGWSSRRNTEKKRWVTVKTAENAQETVATEDHPFAVLESPFQDPSEARFVEAKDTVGKYVLRDVDEERERNREFGLYNDDQLSVIVGTVLGDGCVSKRGELTCNHGEVQREYAEWKAGILGGSIDMMSGMGYDQTTDNALMRAPVTEQTKRMRDLVYGDGVKRFTHFLSSRFDEKALAVFYMDDGCLHKSGSYAQFHVEGFPGSSRKRIARLLRGQFGLESARVQDRSGGYRNIVLSVSDTRKLSDIVAPYFCEAMSYKLLPEYRDRAESYSFDGDRLDVSLARVEDLHYHQELESKLFNVQVEGTSCFFADRSLVHNCDHLNGKTLHGRKIARDRTFESGHEFGRNDRVLMKNDGGDTEEVKFKHADKLREDGYSVVGPA